jgi:hypothetical protein
MRLALLLAALSLPLFLAKPDAGAPGPTRADAGRAAVVESEDEQIIRELELLESMELLQRLDQLDVDTER